MYYNVVNIFLNLSWSINIYKLKKKLKKIRK